MTPQNNPKKLKIQSIRLNFQLFELREHLHHNHATQFLLNLTYSAEWKLSCVFGRLAK